MTKLTFIISSSAVLLSSCATYKEPVVGNEATLVAPQTKLKDALKFWGNKKPAVIIDAIDGSQVWNRWVGSMASNGTYKIAPGDHRIAVFANDASMKHEAFVVMNFKARQSYLIEASPSSEGLRFEIKDSHRKTVTQANSYRSTLIPQTTYIYVPAN